MKKYITFFLIVFIGTLTTQAQINLVLNRVITKTTELGGSFPSQISDTVPAGKVWKIEALYMTTSGNCWYSVNNPNRINLYMPQNGAAPFSFWMQAGDIIYFKQNINTSSDVFISILEFNTTK
jgi:hypothetical protein